MRVVLDTNVLISAALFTGNELEIVRMIETGGLVLILSPGILEEFSRVIARPKFGLIQSEVSSSLEYLLSISEIVVPRRKKTVTLRDKADRMVVDCALAGGAKYIISGDGDLPALRRVGKIRIISSGDSLRNILHRTEQKKAKHGYLPRKAGKGKTGLKEVRDWDPKRTKKPKPVSPSEMQVPDWGEGTENASQEIDEALYGGHT